MFSSEEQGGRQERGQTTVSSGGVWFAPSRTTLKPHLPSSP
ncbi:hypothetical protein [Marinomonas sp. ef1]|nr:hypothetical protein [Marinomonas sp. ef1]